MEAVRQPFSRHLDELRWRLMIVAAFLCIGAGIGYWLRQPLFNILRHPLNQQLYYTSPIGGFNAMLKIAILFGIIVSIPIFMYETVKFLEPAFRRRGSAKPLRTVTFSLFLAACGISFAYFVSLPASLKFLTNLDTSGLKPFLVVNDYLNFVLYFLAGFAILFQLPVIMMFMDRITPLKPGRLMKYQRYVILFSFVIAAILTPTPDPINQTLMALPVILLYQLSVIVVWLRRRKQKAAPPIQPAVIMDIRPPDA